MLKTDASGNLKPEFHQQEENYRNLIKGKLGVSIQLLSFVYQHQLRRTVNMMPFTAVIFFIFGLFSVPVEPTTEQQRARNVSQVWNFGRTQQLLQNNGIYRISTANLRPSLIMTAQSTSNPMRIGEVSLVPWDVKREQMWRVNFQGDGLTLTSLANEFNSVTYFLRQKASSFIVWTLGVNEGLNGQRSQYLLKGSTNDLCLMTQYKADWSLIYGMCHRPDLVQQQQWRFQAIKL